MLPLKDNFPTHRFPILTVLLIAANVIMYFVFQKAGFSGPGDDNVIRYGVIPCEVTNPGQQAVPVGQQLACVSGAEAERTAGGELPATWLTVITSMFMHGGLLHLGGNLLFLWIFGNNIEDSMGRVRFIIFYALGGVAAVAAQTLADPDSAIPMVGASGAIAAVLGAYALLYPRARVVTLVLIIFFITVIELPALLVLGGWFLLQLLAAGSEPLQGGGVAVWAHIGGFAFGLLAIKVFANKVHEDYVKPRMAVY